MCVSLGGVPNTVHKEIEQLIEDRKYKQLYKEYSGLSKNTLDNWLECKNRIDLLSKELDMADNGTTAVRNKFLYFYSHKYHKNKLSLIHNSV